MLIMTKLFICTKNVLTGYKSGEEVLNRSSFCIKMSIAVEHNKLWDWPLQGNDEFVNVVEDSTHFEVDLDAKCFSPKEIKVKTMGDLLQIQMEHDGLDSSTTNINRTILRCYKLPVGVDVQSLKSNLTNKGILHISGKKF